MNTKNDLKTTASLGLMTGLIVVCGNLLGDERIRRLLGR